MFIKYRYSWAPLRLIHSWLNEHIPNTDTEQRWKFCSMDHRDDNSYVLYTDRAGIEFTHDEDAVLFLLRWC